jgi:hypothetical protein
MKHECNVARDLMPLALDGAASGESRRLLDEHLEECAACKEYYDGMKAALPLARAANNEQEQKTFDQAARKLRRKRRFRLLRNTLIGIVIGVVTVIGFLWAWTRLTQVYNTPVYHGNYNVFLSQLADGAVSVNMDFLGSYIDMAVCMEEQEEGGERILYVFNKTTRINRQLNQPMRNYSCMRLSAEDLAGLSEIREGTADDGYAVVWKAGEAIPAASEEMEACFALRDQICDIRFRETEDGKMYTLTYEDSLLLQSLDEQFDNAIRAVPEWQ